MSLRNKERSVKIIYLKIFNTVNFSRAYLESVRISRFNVSSFNLMKLERFVRTQRKRGREINYCNEKFRLYTKYIYIENLQKIILKIKNEFKNWYPRISIDAYFLNYEQFNFTIETSLSPSCFVYLKLHYL